MDFENAEGCMKKRMVIAGANGFMGLVLVDYFKAHYDIHIITRKPLAIAETTNHLWDGKTLGEWAKTLDGAEVLINLAGRSVNCRYNEKNKQEIFESRTYSTKILGEAISKTAKPPKVWLNSSTATIYRHAEDRAMDDETGEIGTGFSVEVAKLWEKTFFDAPTPHTRKVAMRTAMVLGKHGGVLPVMANLVRYGLGGTMASGRQYVSWVHEYDVCRAVEFLIASRLEGTVNLSAPNPLPNALFMKQLRQHLKQPFGLPSTKWMLEIGAVFLQTETELILKSRRVTSTRLEAAGFRFVFPELQQTLTDLLPDSAHSVKPHDTKK
jgi:uncharacterized protein